LKSVKVLDFRLLTVPRRVIETPPLHQEALPSKMLISKVLLTTVKLREDGLLLNQRNS
jgi:hypothetical protein